MEPKKDPDLVLANQCGFETFDDIVTRMNEIVKILQAAKSKVEKNLEMYTILAKEYIKLGEKEKARKQISIKKKKEDNIKIYEVRFVEIEDKVSVAETIYEMVYVLNSIKWCVDALKEDLDKNETGEETDQLKEYQDLILVDNEMNRYLDIITKFNKEQENPPKNISPKDLLLLQNCGFEDLDQAEKKIIEILETMQAARLIVKKSFERFVFQAKRFIKQNQMDSAVEQLKAEIKKDEKIRNYDVKHFGIVKEIKTLENADQLLQIFNEAKSCISILMEELNDQEIKKSTMKLEEYKNLVKKEKSVDDYIDIINNFKKDNNGQ